MEDEYLSKVTILNQPDFGTVLDDPYLILISTINSSSAWDYFLKNSKMYIIVLDILLFYNCPYYNNFKGVTLSSLYAIWIKWIPPLERSRVSSFCQSGSYAGAVFSMTFYAYLQSVAGWRSIFWFSGKL